MRLLDSVTGTVQLTDPALVLNDANLNLDFVLKQGSFQIHVTQKSTGERITSTINVDLDGIAAGPDTTLTSLAADIDLVANINASVTVGGRLQISAASSDFQISFSDDTSDVLAALGINTFFMGGGALDIDVNPVLTQEPLMLAASLGHSPGDNRTALGAATLRDQALLSLNGFSLTEYWSRHVEDFATRLAQAKEAVDADSVVRENLEVQQQSISGVNADEEVINLLQY